MAEIALHERLIWGIDVDTIAKERQVATVLAGNVYAAKIGYSLTLNRMAGLPAALDVLDELGIGSMVDAKELDIPNTMISGVTGIMQDPEVLAAHYGDSLERKMPKLITIHCSAGPLALAAVNKKVEALNAARGSDTQLVGVTVLTSYDDAECEKVYGQKVSLTVPRFAGFALEAGLTQLVSSADDLRYLQEDDDFAKLTKNTPAVTMPYMPANDQQRPLYVEDAIRAGADRLIIARALVSPPPEIGSTSNALELINAAIEQGLRG